MGNDASRTAELRRTDRHADDADQLDPARGAFAPVIVPVLGTSRQLIERVTNVVRLLQGDLGPSAYECYLAELRAVDPQREPLSEREFLARRARTKLAA